MLFDALLFGAAARQHQSPLEPLRAQSSLRSSSTAGSSTASRSRCRRSTPQETSCCLKEKKRRSLCNKKRKNANNEKPNGMRADGSGRYPRHSTSACPPSAAYCATERPSPSFNFNTKSTGVCAGGFVQEAWASGSCPCWRRSCIALGKPVAAASHARRCYQRLIFLGLHHCDDQI